MEIMCFAYWCGSRAGESSRDIESYSAATPDHFTSKWKAWPRPTVDKILFCQNGYIYIFKGFASASFRSLGKFTSIREEFIIQGSGTAKLVQQDLINQYGQESNLQVVAFTTPRTFSISAGRSVWNGPQKMDEQELLIVTYL